jgi:hypothetical protein
MKRTTLALVLALSFVRGTALAESYSAAMAHAHECPTETSWARNDGDGWTAVCGNAYGYPLYTLPDQPDVCEAYAAWAYWACERGYPTADPELGCLAAADNALEACGEW